MVDGCFGASRVNQMIMMVWKRELPLNMAIFWYPCYIFLGVCRIYMVHLPVLSIFQKLVDSETSHPLVEGVKGPVNPPSKCHGFPNDQEIKRISVVKVE